MRKAEYFRRSNGNWECLLCPVKCSLSEKNPLGRCRVRCLENGIPSLPGYGKCVSLSIDPIEKKPLYHFHPCTSVFSTGPAGCNLKCDFCQNWSISQEHDVPARFIEPAELASMAVSQRSSGIAFTYTEPTIWYEFIADTAPLVRERGGYVVMVSNGMINPDPLDNYLEYVSAWNIDLKSWNPDFYKRHCAGNRDAVLRTIRRIADSESHLELTFLLIPGENDKPQEWEEMGEWIAEHCGRTTVLHISRYFPRYKLMAQPTPYETMKQAEEVFSRNLPFVYLGNVAGEQCETRCPVCRTVLIERNFGMMHAYTKPDGKCSKCGCITGIVTDDRE